MRVVARAGKNLGFLKWVSTALVVAYCMQVQVKMVFVYLRMQLCAIGL